MPAPAPAPAAVIPPPSWLPHSLWVAGPNTATVVAGLGAVAGVVAFNTAALGVGALPGGATLLGSSMIPAEMAVAVSRVYAVSSAVVGAWIGDFLYHPDPPEGGTESGRLWAMAAGAVVGVATFNGLTQSLGVLPLEGAALAPIPISTVVGSRLIAVTTGGLGAIGATWAYDKWAGNNTDFSYMFTLLAGTFGGVAAANYLSANTVGSPPLSTGSGLLYSGAVIADAATSAASRVWVVGSGVAGALAADWWYRR